MTIINEDDIQFLYLFYHILPSASRKAVLSHCLRVVFSGTVCPALPSVNPQCWGGHVANCAQVCVWHGMLVVAGQGDKPAHHSFTLKNLIKIVIIEGLGQNYAKQLR